MNIQVSIKTNEYLGEYKELMKERKNGCTKMDDRMEAWMIEWKDG